MQSKAIGRDTVTSCGRVMREAARGQSAPGNDDVHAGADPRPRIAVAPMMDCTDRHARYFLRLVSRRVLLYTEMVSTGALLRGDPVRHLRFDPAEHPLALQLGGSEPREMAACARLAGQWGYDEINMNVGCPSDRVSAGRFGACLMAEPQRVAECVAAMSEAVSVPVTVKCRIGIDGQDSFGNLCRFVNTVSAAGCGTFIVHARSAVLGGLSPKQNRTIPPLRYDVVARLKAEFPRLTMWLNGGVRCLDEAACLLQRFDGVMIGREAYANPWLLADVDRRFHGCSGPQPSREEVLDAFAAYAQRELARGARLHSMTRHIGGLYLGVPGARRWRGELGRGAARPDAGIEALHRAARHVRGTTEHAAGGRCHNAGVISQRDVGAELEESSLCGA